MKEIDFLPEWYKSGRRRQVSYRTQYIILGGIFVVMIVWNFVTSYSMSKAKAQVVQIATKQTQAERVSAKLIELKKEMNIFHKREGLVSKIDSKINVAGILAELSYLIDERIVLSKIDLISGKLVDNQDKVSLQQTGSVVRTTQYDFGAKQELPIGYVLFKVLIAGVASDASDVAALICKLEDSPYFCQVVLSFSRNADLETGRANPLRSQTDFPVESLGTRRNDRESEGNIQVSKFEINCYLANYSE